MDIESLKKLATGHQAPRMEAGSVPIQRTVLLELIAKLEWALLTELRYEQLMRVVLGSWVDLTKLPTAEAHEIQEKALMRARGVKLDK